MHSPWLDMAQRQTTFFSSIFEELEELKAASVKDANLATIHAGLYAAYTQTKVMLDKFVAECQAIESTTNPEKRLTHVFTVTAMVSSGKPSVQLSLAMGTQINALLKMVASAPKEEVIQKSEYIEGILSIANTFDDVVAKKEEKSDSKFSLVGELVKIGAAGTAGYYVAKKLGERKKK